MAKNLRKKQSLQELQHEWDMILAATGFKDIERTIGNDRVLMQFSSNAYRQADSITRENKIAYFESLSEKVNDGIFNNEVDRFIMTRYSEGAKQIQIIEELSHRGHSIHKNTVRYIVRRYETAWGIRAWSNEQMKLKKNPRTG